MIFKILLGIGIIISKPIIQEITADSTNSTAGRSLTDLKKDKPADGPCANDDACSGGKCCVDHMCTTTTVPCGHRKVPLKDCRMGRPKCGKNECCIAGICQWCRRKAECTGEKDCPPGQLCKNKKCVYSDSAYPFKQTDDCKTDTDCFQTSKDAKFQCKCEVDPQGPSQTKRCMCGLTLAGLNKRVDGPCANDDACSGGQCCVDNMCTTTTVPCGHSKHPKHPKADGGCSHCTDKPFSDKPCKRSLGGMCESYDGKRACLDESGNFPCNSIGDKAAAATSVYRQACSVDSCVCRGYPNPSVKPALLAATQEVTPDKCLTACSSSPYCHGVELWNTTENRKQTWQCYQCNINPNKRHTLSIVSTTKREMNSTTNSIMEIRPHQRTGKSIYATVFAKEIGNTPQPRDRCANLNERCTARGAGGCCNDLVCKRDTCQVRRSLCVDHSGTSQGNRWNPAVTYQPLLCPTGFYCSGIFGKCRKCDPHDQNPAAYSKQKRQMNIMTKCFQEAAYQKQQSQGQCKHPRIHRNVHRLNLYECIVMCNRKNTCVGISFTNNPDNADYNKLCFICNTTQLETQDPKSHQQFNFYQKPEASNANNYNPCECTTDAECQRTGEPCWCESICNCECKKPGKK